MDAEILARKRWKPVERVAAMRDEIARKLAAARARVADLQSSHPAAKQRDREARGLALAEGKPAPPSKAKKIERELEEARSLVQDLDAAATVLQRQFQEVLGASRDAWVQSQERAIEQAGNGVLSALAALEQAVGKLEDERGLLAWIEPVPAEGSVDPYGGRLTHSGALAAAVDQVRSAVAGLALGRNPAGHSLSGNPLGWRSVWPLRPSLVGVVSGARSPLPSLRLSPSLSRQG